MIKILQDSPSTTHFGLTAGDETMNAMLKLLDILQQTKAHWNQRKHRSLIEINLNPF